MLCQDLLNPNRQPITTQSHNIIDVIPSEVCYLRISNLASPTFLFDSVQRPTAATSSSSMFSNISSELLGPSSAILFTLSFFRRSLPSCSRLSLRSSSQHSLPSPSPASLPYSSLPYSPSFRLSSATVDSASISRCSLTYSGGQGECVRERSFC